MNDIQNDAPSINGRLHEFSYDVLVRIVPGVCILTAYCYSDFKNHNASTLVGIGAVVAYLVGYGIEMLTLLFDKVVISRLIRFMERTVVTKQSSEEDGKGHSFLPLSENQMWSYEDKSRKTARFFKMIAERAMWRALVFITICFGVWHPPFVQQLASTSTLDPRWICWGMFGVSALGFYFLSYFISLHVRHEI